MAEPAAFSNKALDRLLVFQANGRRYALPHDCVQEIVRPMQLARAPLAPEPLLGLGNLRGAVLPVVDLAALLGSKASADGERGRILVLADANPVGLKVEQVDGLVTTAGADPHTLDRVTDVATVASDATLPDDADTGTFRLLDVAPLLADIFPMRGGGAGGLPRARRLEPEPAEAGATQASLITFRVAGQEFALPIYCVQEVLSPQAGDALTHAGAAVLSVRGRLLPRFSLRRLLGFESEDERAVMTMVVCGSGADVALDVDEVNGIIRITPDEHEAMPAVIARRETEGRLQSVIKLNQGRRLVSVLSPERLFPEDIMNRIGRAPPNGASRSDASTAPTHVYLVFKLDAQEYACSIDIVQEVARLPDQITAAPHAPAYLRGLSNLRGVVLPVIDCRSRFGLPAVDTSASRLVVLDIGGHVAGFVVDAVVDVIRAPETSVIPSPLGLAEDQPLRGVISLAEGARMILLLDPARLLSTSEADLLGTYGNGKEAQPVRDQAPDRR